MNDECEKILGVKFDYKFTFNSLESEMWKHTSQKINPLARVALYISISKPHILKNSLFKSQFNYCLLVWMCYSRINNRKINRHHEINMPQNSI